MKTFITLRNEQQEALPDDLAGDDVRYPEALVRRFLDDYTRPGDLVFDPFAGFGTTLHVAEEMGRVGRGLEYDRRRWTYARSRLRHPARLRHGDARLLSTYGLPPVDFSMTSPPYMRRGDPTDPFAAYAAPGRGYDAYLRDLQDIYRQLGALMKDGARAVVEVSNLRGDDGVTTLAWDIARAVGDALWFEGEVVVCWEPTYGYGYDHSYCLIFSRPL